jgi:hypothetical protein
MKYETCSCMRSKILIIRRYSKWPSRVKLALFKAHCLCLYMMLVFSLVTLLLHSTNYDHVTISAQKCFPDMLYSVTLMMTELGLPSFDNPISSRVSRFKSRWLSSDDNLIANLCSLQL